MKKINNKTRRLTLNYFKTQIKTIVNETIWYWCKDTQISRAENSEIDPHVCGRQIFDKGTKIIQWRKVSLQQWY